MAFLLGSTVTLRVTFTNDAGAEADPTTVTLVYGDAAGTPTTLVYGVDGALVKDATGRYHATIIPDAAGTWLARWIAIGAVETVEETEFDVVPNAQPWDPATYPPIYATLSQLKARIGLNPALAGTSANLASRDDVLRSILQAASRMIDGEVTRHSLGVTTRFYDSVDWPTVPAPITEATILLAIALFKRPGAVFGTLESSMDGAPIRIGQDFHVDALISSVIPWNWAAI